MIDFTRVYDVLTRAKELDDGRIFVKSMDDEMKEFVIQMNTEDQLEEDGVFSDGTPTGEYSPLTVFIKRQKGQRFDHITFKDTGGFYDSFRVEVDKQGFTIDADGQVSADRNLFKFYGENIAGLTRENMDYLVEELTKKYIEIIKHELLS